MSQSSREKRPEPQGDLARGRRRLRIVALVVGLAFAVVAGRLIKLVEWQAPDQRAVATLMRPARAMVSAPAGPPEVGRADVTDRNGVLLATNLRMPSAHVDPSLVRDKGVAARALAGVLGGVDAGQLRHRLETGRRFAWIKHRVTPEEERAILELGIPGVGFKRDTEHRFYPKGELVGHLTGFVDIDNLGLAGVERAFDRRLKEGGRREPLALSVDVRVQQVVRDELQAAARRFNVKGAVGVVLDRVTGETLALVSLPDFDPNRPELASDAQRLNRATGGTYELGSLLKVVSTAQALDAAGVRLGDRFDATQPLKVGRHRIHDDHPQKRWLRVPECFMYSSNICTARMAFAAGGAPAMQGFFQRLGFAEKLGIELPGPEIGRPQWPAKWRDITVATASYGHGIAISPMQFVTALGGIVGDGGLAPATLLKREPGATPIRRQVVEPETARDLAWLMWLGVAKGTGDQARTGAYLVGGKTGTADKPAVDRRGYQQGVVIASFAGVFPLEDPRYVVLAMLDEPRGDAGSHGLRYGGWTAAPVVAAIIDRIGPVLGVPRADERMAASYERRWEAMFGAPLEPEGQGAARVARF